MSREEEFRAFFAAEAEKLRRLAAFLTGDSEGAADLAQEALARAYRHWSRIRDEDPGPYTRRILVNLVCSRHWRRLVERKHQAEAPLPTESPAPRVDEWLRVAAALKSISPMQRAAIVLRFYEDMSEAEIARTLDRPLGTVKSDLHRGLKKLKPILEETGVSR